jgi:non-specific serine/threonine protein kinase
MGRFDDGARHFEAAIADTRRTGARPHLATVLYHPGREFHAAELVAGDGNERQATAMGVEPAAGLHPRRAPDDGAGLSPDAQARSGYARRLREVEEELAEAERHHDLGHAERLRVEQEMLQAELVGTMRGRRTGTHAERARLTVTKGIGSALTRIAEAHPYLGAHLVATIKRGYFCVYVPDPRNTIDWER